MKKLLALLMAILMMVCLVACGGDSAETPKDDNSTPDVNSNVAVEDEGDEDGEEKELLELIASDPYVVCVKAGSTLVIDDITDIDGLRIGFAWDGDGERIARYYSSDESKAIGFGGENDAFSELEGGTGLDCVIVKQMAGQQYQERGRSFVILDPIVIPDADLKK